MTGFYEPSVTATHCLPRQESTPKALTLTTNPPSHEAVPLRMLSLALTHDRSLNL